MGSRSHAVEIVRTLRGYGHQAYLVGGCVRDLLLEREPIDYDVATDATPNEVMRTFPRTWAVGAQFGVVLVPVEEGAAAADGASSCGTRHGAIEVATFRKDGRYSDGRHPDEVLFTRNPEEDVQRRDFTINGLLLDPLARDQVLDFVGGEEDLRAGIIRSIGDPKRRFNEDKLRLLRAVRFSARFGFSIEPETFAAMCELAPQIKTVSHERIRDELTKMLTEGHARSAFELLDESGLLHEVLPEVERMKGVEQPPQYHPEGDVWVHTLLILDMLKAECSRTLAWGALLHDVGKPPTFRVAPDRIRFDRHMEVGETIAHGICARLRMSNEDTQEIAALIANHMRFADVPQMKESTLKRFMRLPHFERHLELHRMDCLASHRKLGIHDLVREKLEQTPPEHIRPALLISGHDLIALGMKPGPEFSAILSAVEDAQLEGILHSKAEALEYVREHTRTSPQANAEKSDQSPAQRDRVRLDMET